MILWLRIAHGTGECPRELEECPRELEITSLAVYFCKDPCAWSDVKAHTAIIESYRRGMGLDDRFTVTKDRQVG